MKKMILMLMAMVVFGNVLGANYGWHDGDPTDLNSIGKSVRIVYPQPGELTFVDDEGKKYVFRYSETNSTYFNRAKIFLSILLTAQTNGSKVLVYYDNENINMSGALMDFATISLKK